MEVPADNSPLLGCLDELDFPAIDFLSRQFLKGVFQIAVRGKLNHPGKKKTKNMTSLFVFLVIL